MDRKAVFSFVLIILLVLFVPAPSVAQQGEVPSGNETVYGGIKNFEKAEVLNTLGLFKGMATGYHLEYSANRAQTAVMITRLLGMEQYVLENEYEHPFTDDVPDWADAHVGWLYQNGLTKGTSQENYSPYVEIPAVHFMTFILRALGYDDSIGEFHYTESLEKALEIGLLSQQEYDEMKQRDTFYRDDMAGISYNALLARLNGDEKNLLEKLIEDGAVSPYTAKLLSLYEAEGVPETLEGFEQGENGYTVDNQQQLVAVLAAAAGQLVNSVRLDITGYSGDISEDIEPAMLVAERAAAGVNGLRVLLGYWEFTPNQEHIDMIMDYLYTTGQLQQAADEADRIAGEILLEEMTDYEKVVAVHDYIVNNTQYKVQGSEFPTNEPYTAFGSLIQGVAVCQGYSEAVNMLLYRSGIYSTLVRGEGKSYDWINHAWNLVKLGKGYYHIDTTFDDPVLQDGKEVLRYSYLNVTDEEISVDHIWETDDYPPCSSTEYNFFYMNDLVVQTKQEFTQRVTRAIEEGKMEIMLKVVDYRKEDYMDISDIVFDTNRVQSYRRDFNDNMGVIWIYDIEYIS